jgi:hypothetical protein
MSLVLYHTLKNCFPALHSSLKAHVLAVAKFWLVQELFSNFKGPLSYPFRSRSRGTRIMEAKAEVAESPEQTTALLHTSPSKKGGGLNSYNYSVLIFDNLNRLFR